jgi:alkylation response protein AidB-like acyl-CoA dehydrogenase
MDFSLPPEIDAVRRRVRDFVEERLIPLEADRANYDAHENIHPDVLRRMRAEAKAADLGRCRCRSRAAAAACLSLAWPPATRR